jgi:hypothetical protein
MHTRFIDADDDFEVAAPTSTTSAVAHLPIAPGGGPARLGVAASIRADFSDREGECYVYDVVTPYPGLPTALTIAASLSTWKIKVGKARIEPVPGRHCCSDLDPAIFFPFYLGVQQQHYLHITGNTSDANS